jgi:hypothetical protein
LARGTTARVLGALLVFLVLSGVTLDKAPADRPAGPHPASRQTSSWASSWASTSASPSDRHPDDVLVDGPISVPDGTSGGRVSTPAERSPQHDHLPGRFLAAAPTHPWRSPLPDRHSPVPAPSVPPLTNPEPLWSKTAPAPAVYPRRLLFLLTVLRC